MARVKATQASGTNIDGEATSSGTVDRVALLLKVLAEFEGDASVAQVVEKMKLPVSTTHRLLNLLVNTSLADRGDRPGSYRVGLEFLRLGGLVVSRMEVTAVAEAFMQRLVQSTGETSILNLYLPAEQQGMIAKVIYGEHPLRIEQDLFKVSSLVYGATGRAMLAFLPQDTITEILAKRESSPVTGKPLGDTRSVLKDLAAVRERGYAHSQSQRVRGAVGFAAPVFKGAGIVLGSLCLSLPEARFVESSKDRFASVLMEQAAKLSAAFGYRPGAQRS